jgi:hypothetical protein
MSKEDENPTPQVEGKVEVARSIATDAEVQHAVSLISRGSERVKSCSEQTIVVTCRPQLLECHPVVTDRCDKVTIIIRDDLPEEA